MALQKAKSKSEFVCQQCGAKSTKWIGRCPSCGDWNTYAEEIIPRAKTGPGPTQASASIILPITEVQSVSRNRMKTGMAEFDRLLVEYWYVGGLVVFALLLLMAFADVYTAKNRTPQPPLGDDPWNISDYEVDELLAEMDFKAQKEAEYAESLWGDK